MCIYDTASHDNKQISSSSVNLLSQMYWDPFDWSQTHLTKTSVELSPEPAGDSFFIVHTHLLLNRTREQIHQKIRFIQTPWEELLHLWHVLLFQSSHAVCDLLSSLLQTKTIILNPTIHTYPSIGLRGVREPCGTRWWQPPAHVWQTAGACGQVCSGSVVFSSQDRLDHNWERSSPSVVLGFPQRWKVWTQTCCIKNSF